jgi:hypothetical protein
MANKPWSLGDRRENKTAELDGCFLLIAFFRLAAMLDGIGDLGSFLCCRSSSKVRNVKAHGKLVAMSALWFW